MDFNYYVEYFSMLEERLKNTGRYVAFESENLSTFSVEYASIINECCALINGFCTEVCKISDSDETEYKMNDYKTKLVDLKYQFDEYISFGKFILQPWERMLIYNVDTKDATPSWWHNYNDIKHGGKFNFKAASLKNAISCMSGMFWLLLNYDISQQGTTMFNWHGVFCGNGNCKRKVSWEC